MDLVHNRYVLLNVGEVFCFDTTERGDVYITLLIEVSTRYIITFLLTKHKPSAEEIKSLLQHFIFNLKNKSKQIIIHSDCAGENSSNAIREFCLKNNIKSSYSETIHGNQVSESVNKTLWYEIGKVCIADLESIQFKDLEYNDQKMIIWYVISKMNRREKTNSSVLFKGCSPEEMYEASCLYNYITNKIVMAKNGTEKATQIKIWKNIQIMLYRNLKTQTKLQEEKNISLNIADTPEAYKNLNYPETLNTDWLLEKEVESEIKYRLMKKIDKLDTEKIIEFIKVWVKSEEAKNLSDYQKIQLQIEVMNSINLKENTNLTKENVNITSEVKELAKESLEENKRLRIQLEENTKTLEAYKTELQWLKEDRQQQIAERKKKEDLSKKRRANKASQSNPSAAVESGDLDIILEGIHSRVKYVFHRDRIAHCIINYAGFRIGNLRWFGIYELKQFFNYETIYLRPIKSKNGKPLIIPVGRKYAGRFVEKLRPDWIALQKILIEKGMDLNAERGPYKIKESELWGSEMLCREGINRRMNKQLKIAGLKLNKKLTSHAYRRGLAQSLADENPTLAQDIMNHVNYSTTALYTRRPFTKKRAELAYEIAHSLEYNEPDE